MGRVWMTWCADDWYGPVRREIASRGSGVQIVRVNSIESAMQLGRAYGAGGAGVAMVCTSGNVDVVVSQVGRVRSALEGCSILVFTTDCGADEMARLLRSGAKEVIAMDTGGGAVIPPACSIALEAYMRNDDCTGSHTQDESGRDDLVPLEELWPPLDEPDETGVIDVANVNRAMEEVASGERDEPGTDADLIVQDPADLRELASRASARASMGAGGHRAPLVAVISGRGGVGKTTLVAALAASAAHAGLRAAVVDLDVMFGDLPSVLGAQVFKGLEQLVAHERGGVIADCDIEASAMRIGPGLTLWGPLEQGERAELFGDPVEQLLAALRSEADVIFVDTSCSWGDAVAVAVGACDRCLLVGSGGETSGASAARAVELAARLGVPATRMTSVFNKMGARGCGEEDALRFEMGASIRSRVRIADGGDAVSGMLSFGQLDALVSGDGAFAKSVRSFAFELLNELGCSVDERAFSLSATPDERKFSLPWRRKREAMR